MNWTSLLFVIVGLAIVYYYFFYSPSQSAAPVAKKHQQPVPEGDITAIEYFWRPG